ncbi:GD20215 [Drosophila simulans]|uniref:GD20215 n=1 Tax=Drosophila simulans TaxID=7240 RepID=B4QV44_DROSI|nr:GD20215 [Drosophila simulans]
MSHNRENLRLSLLDLQATLTAPSQTVAAALLPQAPAHMQQLPSGSSSNISNSSSNTHSHSSSNISACGSSSNINTGVSQAVSMATTTVARLSKAGFGAAAGSGGGAGSVYQNDKCDRLKKMTSITCSDSEDDSERRAQFEISSKWNLGGYEGDTRTYVVQEIYRNEQSYVESLQTVVVKYLKVLKAPEHAGMIDTRTVDEIFFMVPDILEIHEKFLSDLKSRLDDWDVQQKVGDAFMDTFSKLEVLEVYTSFVNNCNRAKNAIRSMKHQRPSFSKFLETTAREHKGKLTLDNLLIKPVQKFPNYELLFQRLIKHTDHDHPDTKHLQDVLKLVHDILVHINCKEREIMENGQREATLRELEGVIEGITDLIAPERQFLLFDLVSMPSGQGARKDRGFFLFNDLLVLTSIKKRSGTIRKPNSSICPGTVATTLDTNKYKFLTKISLDCLEIVKSKDENIKRIVSEIETLAEDCNKLQQITDITVTLKYPHQYLEDVIRELHREVQRQLSERQTNDTQLNMLELTVSSPNGNQKLAVVFSKTEKRTQWEESFNEAKQKLAATLERHPIPEFLTSIPIRKTRAGLQFTCAAATLSDNRDVWVCNSDGYVGQVCIMSLHPEPNVTSCNGVCNARILCVASVPAYSSAASSRNSSGEQPTGSGGQEEKDKRNTPQSYTQQLRDYRKSISPSFQSASASATATPEKKKLTPTPTPVAGGEPADAATTGGSDTQLELNLSSSDDETEAAAASLNVAGSTGSTLAERVPSPAPSYHGHQDSNPEEGESNQSTMWIGTEDGCIHVYNSTDNIRIKKNRIKIEHHSAVYSILYLDNRVFVSLANGDICVYLRDGATSWNTCSSHCLSIGTVTSPVNKLLNVNGRLWCSIQGIIKVLDVETLTVVNQIQISSDSKPITNMTVSNNHVWISIQNSAHIKCFHSNTSIKHSKSKSETNNTLIISGGDGYEDFRNSGANSLSEIAGREDSTNHLLIWQI